MAIPELPQDIIDTIVQAFAEIVLSDKDQLKKLSLVSHAFFPQSQRCIFDTISLLRDGYRDPNPPYHPFGERVNVLGGKLHALLQTSPHLFAYIHVLKVHAWSSAELAWVTSEGEEVAAIIRACSSLQTLEMGSNMSIEWPVMHPSLRSSLILRIQSAQLEELTLINVKDVPRILLSALGCLRTLHLESVSFNLQERQNSAASPKIKPSRPSIERLCIEDSNPCVRLLLDEQIISPQLHTLDMIRYEHTAEDPSLIDDLLDRARGIRELHMVVLPNTVDVLRSIAIDSLQNLRRISIFTRPTILRDTYSFIKSAIATSTTLHSANVILPMANVAYWIRSCLATLHLWADFYSEPQFQQLTLSFIVLQVGCCEVGHTVIYTEDQNFEVMLRSIIGRNEQLLSCIIQGKVLIKYIYVQNNIWTESMNIRRCTIDNSVGQVDWHTWNPLEPDLI